MVRHLNTITLEAETQLFHALGFKTKTNIAIHFGFHVCRNYGLVENTVGHWFVSLILLGETIGLDNPLVGDCGNEFGSQCYKEVR